MSDTMTSTAISGHDIAAMDDDCRREAQEQGEAGYGQPSPIERALGHGFFLLLTHAFMGVTFDGGIDLREVTREVGSTDGSVFNPAQFLTLMAQSPGGEFWKNDKRRPWPQFFVHPQVKIGPYTVDFTVCAALETGHTFIAVLECDGHDYHERTKEQAARDKQRDRDLQVRGYPVLRFTGSEIWRSPMRTALAALEAVEQMTVDRRSLVLA